MSYGKKVDLMLRVIILPFSNLEFNENEIFEKFRDKFIKENKNFNLKLGKEDLNQIYKIINSKEKIFNLDEIKLWIEKYFEADIKNHIDKSKSENPQIGEFYLSYMNKLAKSFLSNRDGKICLKYWESEEENEVEFLGSYRGIHKVLLWNSLNRMMSIDLLVCVYVLFLNIEHNSKNEYEQAFEGENYLDNFYYGISLEDSQLEKILQKGISENHIHVSAGGNFYMNWEIYMSKPNKDRNEEIKNKFQEIIIFQKENMEYKLKQARIMRFLISKYLYRIRLCSIKKMNFKEYIFCRSNSDKELERIVENFENQSVNEEILDAVYTKIYEKYEEKYTPENEEDKVDIYIKILSTNQVDTPIENIFLYKALKYILQNKDDTYFSKIFFQYIRIKNEIFQLSVQQNQIKGLINFKEYFSKSKLMNNKKYWEMILKNQFQDLNLKKIEIRKGIAESEKKESEKKELETLRDIFISYNQIIERRKSEKQNTPMLGIVYHFIKQEDSGLNSKCWLKYGNGMYSEDGGFMHYQGLRLRLESQINIIKRMRFEIPGMDEFIVGIDAASSENDAEPWVFAPVYRSARNGMNPFLNSRNRKIKSLGYTFHAGEDFRHILTGLRRIDEVVEHFGYKAGDRIGHGIALGVNVSKWCQSNPSVVMPRIEYLENLLWIWGLCKQVNISSQIDERYLERTIMEQAQRIYKRIDGITVFELWGAYQDKFKDYSVDSQFLGGRSVSNCDELLRRERFEYSKDINQGETLFCCEVDSMYKQTWNREKLKLAYNCKVYLKRMYEVVHIDVEERQIEIIEEVQKLVVINMAKKGIIVETNPTSNRAIGEVEHIFNHYISNLSKSDFDDEADDQEAMITTINSDDPSVFQTNLSAEFAYIYYAMLNKGYSRKKILTWIDNIREYGMQTSFIRERDISIEVEEIIQNIDNRLNQD